MALSSVPPWLDITPQFFTSAAEGGARLGLAARAQDTEEASAADRLKLAYTQLASQEKIASAKAQQELNFRNADLLLRAHANAGLQQYRAQEAANKAQVAQNAADVLAERVRHNKATESTKSDDATKELTRAEHELDVLATKPDTEDNQKAADAWRMKAIFLRNQIQGRPSTPTSKGQEVTRRTKDGKLAVFDATTKKFLRYADTNVGGDNPANQ